MKANDEVDLFGAKSWAMGIVIHALLPPIIEKMGADSFGFAPYPTFPGNEPRSYSEGTASSSRRRRRRIPGRRRGLGAAQGDRRDEDPAPGGQVPVRRAVAPVGAGRPVYKSDPLLGYLANYTFKTATPFPFIKEVDFYSETLIEALNLIVLQRQPVDETLKRQQARYEAAPVIPRAPTALAEPACLLPCWGWTLRVARERHAGAAAPVAGRAGGPARREH